MFWGFVFLVWACHAWGACYGACSSPLSLPMASFPSVDSLVGPFSSWLHPFPFYPLWCDLFSTFCCGEFVLPVFGLLSRLLYCGCYAGVSMGWSEPKTLLLHHLPWKSYYLSIFKSFVYLFLTCPGLIFPPFYLEALNLIYFLKVYLSWKREYEWKKEKRKRRERIPSRFCAVSVEPNSGLDLKNHNIMIWA